MNTVIDQPTAVTEIDSNLDPKLPFPGAGIETHHRMGKIVIERRGDELWVGGMQISLQTSGQLCLNACVLDFLVERPEFMPAPQKKDEFVCIIFKGTTYNHNTSHYQRVLEWFDGAWQQGSTRLYRKEDPDCQDRRGPYTGDEG